jgi:hypothetical protein
MSFLLFAYFGPESMLPLTSVVATVVGIFLMFGRNTLRMVRRTLMALLSQAVQPRSVPKPHFPVEAEKRISSEASPS